MSSEMSEGEEVGTEEMPQPGQDSSQRTVQPQWHIRDCACALEPRRAFELHGGRQGHDNHENVCFGNDWSGEQIIWRGNKEFFMIKRFRQELRGVSAGWVGKRGVKR